MAEIDSTYRITEDQRLQMDVINFLGDFRVGTGVLTPDNRDKLNFLIREACFEVSDTQLCDLLKGLALMHKDVDQKEIEGKKTMIAHQELSRIASQRGIDIDHDILFQDQRR